MAMNYPYTISVFQLSLISAHQFLNVGVLGNNLVQFLPDPHTKGGYWVVLRVTGDQMAALIEQGKRQQPRWSILS